jgi:hypothetical protein
MARRALCCVCAILAVLVLCVLRVLRKRAPANLPPLDRRLHVLYINLEKDVERREKYRAAMPLAYPEHLVIERVPGVEHRWGVEGCRAAHSRALARAHELGHRYVLVTEDDVVPSGVGLSLPDCLSAFLASVEKLDDGRAPVMLLLECGEALETRVRLRECRGGAHFRRIIFGGNNAGAYLIRRDFIPAVRTVWGCCPFLHIDITWQILWPFNQVWMAFPPPLKQRTVWSHNLKAVRQATRPFDVDAYWARNRNL